MSTHNQRGRSAGGWSRVVRLVSGVYKVAGSLQQVFPKAESYTVTFTLNVIDDINQHHGFPPHSVPPITAEAIVEFTVAGNTYVRLLSVTDGMSISGVCNSFRVRLKDTTVAVGNADILGLRYDVSVQVAPGTRADSKSPPYLQRGEKQIVVAANSGHGLTIPDNAGIKTMLAMVVAINGSVIPDGGARVTQSAAAVDIAAYDPRSFAWAPIAPGAAFVELQNFTGTDQFWQVFWGIDG